MNRTLLKKNIKIKAFSMIEVMTALIILGIITAATVPIITRKYTNKSYTVSKASEKKAYGKKCAGISDNCLYCTVDDNNDPKECLICKLKCSTYKDIGKCQCIQCDDPNREDGVTNCEACTTDDNEKIVCTKCKIDYYLDNNTCKLCTNDNNSDGNVCDGAIKSPCPPGTFGYYNDDPNADPNDAKYMCMYVPGGYYQSESGKVAANNIICPAGSYCCGTSENCAGATEPLQCSAGEYSSAGQTACSKCSAGTYSNAGASECTTFTGKNCLEFDQAGGACNNCANGYYMNNGKCETCAMGFYMSDSVNKICSPCSEGTSTSSNNTASTCSEDIGEVATGDDGEPDPDEPDPDEPEPDEPEPEPDPDEPDPDEPGVDDEGGVDDPDGGE